jgi:selenocysteine lyase/cysteine desulfurase
MGSSCGGIFLIDRFVKNVVIYSSDASELSSDLNPSNDRINFPQRTIFRDRLRISTHIFHNKRDVRGLVNAMSDFSPSTLLVV